MTVENEATGRPGGASAEEIAIQKGKHINAAANKGDAGIGWI
jgi:hypothetical protein